MAGAGLGKRLRAGDTVLVGTGTGEPAVLIEELVEAARRVPGICVIQVMTGGAERLAEVAGETLRLRTPMPGPKTRKAIAEGRAELLTQPMSGLLRSILDGELEIAAVLLQGRDRDGLHATPGLIADIMVPAWERARFRALELNDRLPIIGCDTPLEIAAADLVVHSSREPNELREDPISDAATRIGSLIAEIVPDGATIELGIGRALAGVAPALASARRGLGMHTGIVGDAAMRLIEAGSVSRAIRGEAMAVGATAMGTRDFYRWADRNPRIALVDSRIAHDPASLAATQRFVAINSALQVDLQGNVNSVSHKGRIVSGVGGGGDFAAAGARAEASIVALFSTTPDGASTIVPVVEAVSVPAAHVTHVVTEHGTARIGGLGGLERARAIAAVADPRHRREFLG